MFTIGKAILSIVLLVGVAAAPIACLSINKPANDQPKTDVNVGGQHGVTVDHNKNPDSTNN